jgi:hypothetical protein
MKRLKIVFKNIKYRYLEWKWDRILKKSGFDTWESYLDWYDIGYNPRGSTIRECLPGYPYLVKINVQNLRYIQHLSGTYWDTSELRQWCNDNCREARGYRIQSFFIGRHNTPYGSIFDGGLFRRYHEGGNLKIDSNYLDEVLIAGFKNSEDASMCTLTWG